MKYWGSVPNDEQANQIRIAEDTLYACDGRGSRCWEGGHRVSFIVKWLGRIPAASLSDTSVNFTDLFATLAELLEVDLGKTWQDLTIELK